MEDGINSLWELFCNDSDASSVVDGILGFLGAKVRSKNQGGAISGIVDLGGGTQVTRSDTLVESVASAQHERAMELASRDF